MPETVGELVTLLSSFKDDLPVRMENHHGERQLIKNIKIEKYGAKHNAGLVVVLQEDYKV